VWVSVLPDMSGFSTALRAGLALPMGANGKAAGTAYSKGMMGAVRAGMTPMRGVVGAEATASADAAAAAVSGASSKVALARKREADAAGAVRVAESRLAELRAKGTGAPALIAAEERLAKAQRTQTLAADALTTAESRLKAAQAGQAEAATAASASSATATSRFGAMRASVVGGSTAMTAKLGGLAKGALGMGALFGGLEIAKFGVESIKTATDFQKSSNVLVTAAGESVTNLVNVRKGLLGISSETGTNLDQMTEGMYTVEKAGLRGAKGLAVMESAAKGARDEGADLGVVTNALTSMMTAYGGSMKNPDKAMNALMVAAGNSKTTLQDYANSLSNVLPVGAKLGLGFNQIAGALGTMTSTGMSAQQAAQNLNHVLAALAAPTRVMATEMDAFGISAEDVRDNLGKRGVQGTIELLSNAVKSQLGPAAATATKVIAKMPGAYKDLWAALSDGRMTLATFENKIGRAKDLTETQKDAILKAVPAARGYAEAMKNMTGGIVGLNTSMMLTGDASKGLAERTTAVGEAMNSTDDFTKKWGMSSKTAGASMAIAGQTIKNAGVALGTQMLPGLAKGAQLFATLTTSVVKFVQQNSGWIGPLVKGLGLILGVILAITTATKIWTIAVGIFNAVMDANPITIVIVAIAALVAGVIYAYNHFGWFKDGVQAAWKGIQVAAKAVGDWFSGTLWPLLKKIFAWTPLGLVVGNWGAVKAFFSGLVKGISGFFESAWGIIKQVFGWSPLGLVTEHFGDILGFFKKLPGKIADAIGTVANVLTSPFRAGFAAVAHLWNSTVGKIHFNVPDWVPGVGGKGFSFPTIPGYARGVLSAPGGLALVGEDGPEVIQIPRGSRVYPNGTGPRPGGGVQVHVDNIYAVDENAAVDRLTVKMRDAVFMAGLVTT